MSEISDDRRQSEELLPWYLTEQLATAEAESVATALQENPDMMREAEFLKQIQAAVLERDVVPSPGEFGLARLRRSIEREQIDEQHQPQTSTGATIIQKDWGGWRAIAIAACLVVAILLGYQVTNMRDDNLDLAGSPSSAVLQVTFKPTATEVEIRTLMQALNLKIVDGPSALGLYRLQTDNKGEDLKAILVRLRAATTIVESVEAQ